MKKIFSIIFAGVLFILPAVSLAHGHSEFKIGSKVYQFVVGSINEPIAVDDKTAVDLRINEVIGGGHADSHEEHSEITKAVAGLEKDIKVELIAGAKKKTLDFSPAHKDPGAYKAYFIPTVQTTYTYRVFGKINGIEINLPFTCNPVGHVVTEEEMQPTEISPGVVQTEKTGAFGCPLAKAELGFPEQSAAIYDLTAVDEVLSGRIMSLRKTVFAGLGVAFLALIVGIGAFVKRKNS